MTDLDRRLQTCFVSVFPQLAGDDVTTADHHSVEGWDSIATATLLSVVCEEFDLPMDPEGTEDLVSFAGFRTWVQSRLA